MECDFILSVLSTCRDAKFSHPSVVALEIWVEKGRVWKNNV